jgi:hypothetical protein
MLVRILRSGLASWLAVVLIAPLVVLGAFNRATFLAHGHDDHGMHLHAVGILHTDSLDSEGHTHGHGRPHSGRRFDCGVSDDHVCCDTGEVPCGELHCVDVHKLLPKRSATFKKSLSPAAVFAMVAFVLPTSPDLNLHVGSPGGGARDGPMDLLALSANDRLVRTSRALLI